MMKRELRYKGSFYPKTEIEVRNYIRDTYTEVSQIENLKGIIVPHAGWVYSGGTAIRGFSHIPMEEIQNIYLIGPSHHFRFQGVAISGFTTYETLGDGFNINKDIEKELLQIPDVNIVDNAHINEHSLEVELEFLKHFYSKASLIPIVAGRNADKPLRAILERSLNETGSITIISSDLSHYNPYPVAEKLDRKTIELIKNGNGYLDFKDACGSSILNALIEVNKDSDFCINLIEYKNSGDTAGDKKSVVGYCSMEIITNG